jgi:hypothetical protein
LPPNFDRRLNGEMFSDLGVREFVPLLAPDSLTAGGHDVADPAMPCVGPFVPADAWELALWTGRRSNACGDGVHYRSLFGGWLHPAVDVEF